PDVGDDAGGPARPGGGARAGQPGQARRRHRAREPAGARQPALRPRPLRLHRLLRRPRPMAAAHGRGARPRALAARPGARHARHRHRFHAVPGRGRGPRRGRPGPTGRRRAAMSEPMTDRSTLASVEKLALLARLARQKERAARFFALTFVQQRLWFLDQLDPGSHANNIFRAVTWSGPLDAEALRRALSEVVRRHEALRSFFPEVDGEPRQKVAPAGAPASWPRRSRATASTWPADLSSAPVSCGWRRRSTCSSSPCITWSPTAG